MKMKPNRSLKIVLLYVAAAALGSLSALQIAAMEAMPLGKEEEATPSDAFNATSMVKELENLCAKQKKEANQPNNPFAIVSEQCATRTAMELAQCIIASQEHQELYDALISFFVSKLNQDLYKKTDDEKTAVFKQKRFDFDEMTKQQLNAEYKRQNNWQLKNMFSPNDKSNQVDVHRHIRAQVAPDCLSDSLYQLLFSMDATLDAQYVKELGEHKGWVSSVAWSPDGKHVLTGSFDTAKIWDVNSGICKHTLKGHAGSVNSVAWSPDGKQVLIGSSDNTAKIWDVNSGICKHTLTGHTDCVTSVAWSPDSKQVLTGSWDKTAKIWDVNSGICKHTLTGHTNWIFSVAWSPDGNHVLTGSFDGTAKIWDAKTCVCKHTLKGHAGSVNSVAWSPDGSYILTGSFDTAKIWDVNSGICKHTLTGHAGWVRSVAWSPDGKQVLIGSSDNTAKIWDVNSGICKHTLKGHTGRVSSVVWSPDGKYVLTGSHDNTAKIWDVTLVKDYQAEIQSLSLEQLMLLNYLDQLIQQKDSTVPEHLHSVAQELPKGIRAKIETKITLPANSWYESCAIL